MTPQAPMGEPRRPPRREDIWIQILRDTDLEGEPARSEGLELIETTDPDEFLDVGWAELLLVNDFFVRILLRAAADPAFVTGWTRHSGAGGDATLMLCRRIAEVCEEWLRRLDMVARHHRDAGTSPSRATSIPRSLYRSRETLDLLIAGVADQTVGFDMLRALTRICISHASVSAARALAESASPPDTTHDAASWINALSSSVMDATSHVAPSLGALDPPTWSTIQASTEQLLSRYETDLREELTSRHGAVATERRIVVVDAQLACDICALRAAGALMAAWRSGRESDWAALARWRSEGRRMLDDRPRRAAHLGRLDLSGVASWFEPNFGGAWPSCVADAEEIARFFLTAVAARGSRRNPEAPEGPGDILDILTRSHVMRFRIPGATARPGEDGSPAEAASVMDPLLAWLLFPSTGAATNGRFWRDSAYGRFVSALETMGPGEGSTSLFPELPADVGRAVAGMAEPLIAKWGEGEKAQA